MKKFTEQEVALIVAAAIKQALGTPAKATKPAKKAVAKPTKAQALATWKQAHNRTEETIAKFNAIKAERYATDWAVWVASAERNALTGIKRSEANAKKSAELVRAYQLAAGMKY